MKILAITPNGKHDYLAASILEGLKKYKLDLYCTGIGNGAVNIINDEEFKHHYKTCDYIFAIWGKCIYNGIPEPKFYLIDDVNGWKKTVYIDGSEYNYTSFPGLTKDKLHPLFKEKARWYFKRECLPEHIDSGVIPLPFAAIKTDFGNFNEKKQIDVLCAFGQSATGKRKMATEVCEELKSDGYNIITHHVNDYFRVVNQSWITIDAHGGGECNARTFQIPANNSALFCEKYNIIIPKLTHKHNCIEWNSKKELKEYICYYLENKLELQTMIKNGYDDVLKYQTYLKRVEYLLNHIKIGEHGPVYK